MIYLSGVGRRARACGFVPHARLRDWRSRPSRAPRSAPLMAWVAAGALSPAYAPDSAPSPLRKAERDAWLGVRVLPCIVCRRRCAASVCLSLQCPEGWLADALPPCASAWVTSGRVSGRCGGPVLITASTHCASATPTPGAETEHPQHTAHKGKGQVNHFWWGWKFGWPLRHNDAVTVEPKM